MGGIGGPWQEGKFINTPGEVEDITKKVKGIASCEFPKEKSLAEYNPESGTHKYFKCQTPPYEKTSCFKMNI